MRQRLIDDYEERFEFLLRERGSQKFLFDLFSKYCPKGRIADFGCGNGLFLEYFNGDNYETHGLDIFPEIVHRTKGYSTARLVVGDVVSAPYRDESFDGVLSNEVIEHVLNCDRHLREIHRCLKKGGLLLVVTPHKRGLLAMLMGKRWYYYQDPTHCLLFDKATLRSYLEAAGFKVIKMKTYFHLSGFAHRNGFLRNLKIFKRLDFSFPQIGDELVVISQKVG